MQVTTGVHRGSMSTDNVLYRGSHSEVYSVLVKSTSGTERAASEDPVEGVPNRKSSRGSDLSPRDTCSWEVSFSGMEDCGRLMENIGSIVASWELEELVTSGSKDRSKEDVREGVRSRVEVRSWKVASKSCGILQAGL